VYVYDAPGVFKLSVNSFAQSQSCGWPRPLYQRFSTFWDSCTTYKFCVL